MQGAPRGPARPVAQHAKILNKLARETEDAGRIFSWRPLRPAHPPRGRSVLGSRIAAQRKGRWAPGDKTAQGAFSILSSPRVREGGFAARPSRRFTAALRTPLRRGRRNRESTPIHGTEPCGERRETERALGCSRTAVRAVRWPEGLASAPARVGGPAVDAAAGLTAVDPRPGDGPPMKRTWEETAGRLTTCSNCWRQFYPRFPEYPQSTVAVRDRAAGESGQTSH